MNSLKHIAYIFLLSSFCLFLLSGNIFADATDKQDTSLINQRIDAIKAALNNNPPVLNQLKLSKDQTHALAITLKSPDFLKDIAGDNGQTLLSEIFSVRAALPSDWQNHNTPFELNNTGKSFIVERYNYALNQTIIALIADNKLIRVEALNGLQADLPEHLGTLAVAIARTSDSVKQALENNEYNIAAVMAHTKTALNNSRCERSQKLCVAPTFVYGEKALWAIVNLTDLNVAGIRWTNVGSSQAEPVSERAVQDNYIAAEYCEKSHTFSEDPWQFKYHLTVSDGLEVFDVKYKNKIIIESVKLVDWHVSYSRVDGFGYSDAIGCPTFSEAAVIATSAPKIISNQGNVALKQDYFSQGWPQPCSYNYSQTAEFNQDGSWRFKAANLGRGCGNDATYRPVYRYVFPKGVKIEQWQNNSWKLWHQETWSKQNEATKYYENKYQWRITYPDNFRLLLEPANGQFDDDSRQDNAHVFLTKHKTSEGDGNLITIGPCCNNDHRQGPERFIEDPPESIDEQVVLWYVPSIRNDDRAGHEYCWAQSTIVNGLFSVQTFPCYSGPRFVPYEQTTIDKL